MFRELDRQVLVADSPMRPRDMADAAARGVTLAINNRPDGEAVDQVDAASLGAAAKEAGLAYLHLPVDTEFSSDKVAALVIGLVITTVERLFRFFAPMLEPYAAGLIDGLYQVLPGYHLANLAEWLTEGHVLTVPFPSGPFSMAPGASLAIVAVWTIGLVALTFRVFRRQNIN